jgi:hypothetical protein
MVWTWRFEASDGGRVDPEGVPTPQGFPTQSDAESWIGESWRALLEVGVDQVTLLENGHEVYGPMSLHPPT